jgi:hypothetical protein
MKLISLCKHCTVTLYRKNFVFMSEPVSQLGAPVEFSFGVDVWCVHSMEHTLLTVVDVWYVHSRNHTKLLLDLAEFRFWVDVWYVHPMKHTKLLLDLAEF